MAEERFRRKLAAILAADVAGYSRMTETDEEDTLNRLRRLRTQTIEPLIAEHRGRVVKLMGDGALVEFASAVDAVRCAVEIQGRVDDLDADTPSARQIRFRIGINLGDVVVDDDDLLGDGVNIASRLEQLAEPGGICISAKVFEEVGNKLDLVFEDMGEREVKNIARPVRVYGLKVSAVSPLVDVSAPVAGFAGRPAIAVLPFDNMSGDPAHGFFVDGLTEDLILRLSSWKWFPVIARNSTFVFKGHAVDIRDVGRKLGARYVVEGSVRKSGNRIRVTAQLIDATDHRHVWAERYDRDLADTFAVQDEITDRIVGALEPVIGDAEQHRARVGRPENLDAWELCQRAFWHYYRVNRQDQQLAKEWFRKSIAMDPELAMAWGGLSIACYYDVVTSWTSDVGGSIEEMRAAGLRAVAIGDHGHLGRFGLGFAHIYSRQYDSGIREMERGIEENPSSAHGYYLYSMAHMFAGHSERAVEGVGRALRLSPRDYHIAQLISAATIANVVAGNYEQAIMFGENATARAPEHPLAHRNLAVALASLGRMDEARAAIGNFKRLVPSYSIETFRRAMPFKDSKDADAVIGPLRRLGVPESS
ncbi:MAG: adenylate/guanylate cyclase domain-containing protein [Mesorhizobium sp.]|nr:MAG: adenylate/guanylate cyclase domain-containing protein [Mesorhizobium sp.]TIT83662.1 MAG: adenylate/guanylate cyclase domain-containing protein [Mesorhizobium sp.]